MKTDPTGIPLGTTRSPTRTRSRGARVPRQVDTRSRTPAGLRRATEIVDEYPDLHGAVDLMENAALGPRSRKSRIATTAVQLLRKAGIEDFVLLQVDTKYAMMRAEHGRLEIADFDAATWGEALIRPTLALPGVVGRADLSIRPVRFVSRADILAFQGTETVFVGEQ